LLYRSRYLPALFLVLVLTLPFYVSPAQAQPYQVAWSFTDDFYYSNDTAAGANWYILRSPLNATSTEVVWDPAAGWVYITNNGGGADAGIYLKSPDMRNYTAWEVDFISFIGNSTTAYPADGLAFTFYHNLVLGFGGENMGARLNGSTGFLIEYDPYQNTGEPTVPHIALASASVPSYYHSYIYYTGPILNKWLYTKVFFQSINVTPTYITGYLTVTVWDNVNLTSKTPIGTPIFNSTNLVTFHNPQPYLGFTAATGLYTELHIIDWVNVTFYKPAHLVGGSLASPGGIDGGEVLALVSLSILGAAILYLNRRRGRVED